MYLDVVFLVLVQPQESVAFVCLGRILGGIFLSTDSPPFSPCSLSRTPVAVLSSAVSALCDPVGYGRPGLPVHHHALELAQTHVH